MIPFYCTKKKGDDTFIVGPKGSIENYGIVEDDFILAIQTKDQKVRYEGNASKIVCADSTHNTTQYGFKLTNVIVPDEFHKGYPVALLISNKENTETLTLSML